MLMSDLSHVPLKILNSIHTNTEYALLFLAFAHAEPLTWDVLPFYAWELSYDFQDPDQTCLEREAIPELCRQSPSPWATGIPYLPHFSSRHPVLLCVYTPMSSSRGRGRV